MGSDPIRAVAVGLTLAIVLAVIGALSALSGRTVYTSYTTMLIDNPLALAGQPTEFANLDALRYKYSALVNTDAIAVPVAQQLHLPVSAVIGALTTDVPPTSLLMDVDATWSTPREAQLLSQDAADQVTNYVNAEDSQYNIPPADRFTFDVIDPASAPLAQRPSKSKALTLAIGLAILGLALGFLATQLFRYLR